MKVKNFTPLNDLAKKQPRGSASLAKESEPIAPKEAIIQEAVEYEPEKSVLPFIQKRSETINLPPDLKKIGLRTTATSKFSQYQNIKVPLADDKIVSGLHAPITSSLRWLATLALYILRQAHLGLKTVHGHVVRVFKK